MAKLTKPLSLLMGFIMLLTLFSGLSIPVAAEETTGALTIKAYAFDGIGSSPTSEGWYVSQVAGNGATYGYWKTGDPWETGTGDTRTYDAVPSGTEITITAKPGSTNDANKGFDIRAVNWEGVKAGIVPASAADAAVEQLKSSMTMNNYRDSTITFTYPSGITSMTIDQTHFPLKKMLDVYSLRYGKDNAISGAYIRSLKINGQEVTETGYFSVDNNDRVEMTLGWADSSKTLDISSLPDYTDFPYQVKTDPTASNAPASPSAEFRKSVTAEGNTIRFNFPDYLNRLSFSDFDFPSIDITSADTDGYLVDTGISYADSASSEFRSASNMTYGYIDLSIGESAAEDVNFIAKKDQTIQARAVGKFARKKNYVFHKWEIHKVNADGTEGDVIPAADLGLADEDLQKQNPLSFKMPGYPILIRAYLVGDGVPHTVTPSHYDAYDYIRVLSKGDIFNSSIGTISLRNQQSSFATNSDGNLGLVIYGLKRGYEFKGFTVTPTPAGTTVTVQEDSDTQHLGDAISYTLIRDAGVTAVEVYAEFAELSLVNVEVLANQDEWAQDGNVWGEAEALLVNKDGTTTAGVTEFYKGDTVQLKATPDPGETGLYAFRKWEVTTPKGAITLDDPNAEVTTFTMPDENVQIKAYFGRGSDSDKNEIVNVALLDGSGKDIGATSSTGDNTITLKLPETYTDTQNVQNLRLQIEPSLYATVEKAGGPKDGDDGGKLWSNGDFACGMALGEEAAFTVTAENGDKQTYTIAILPNKSADAEITDVKLLDSGKADIGAACSIVGTDITLLLPEDFTGDTKMLAMQMEYSDGATVAQQGGSADNATQSWRNGDFMCNMLTDTPKTFTVTAEDGLTSVDYTIVIKTAVSVVPQELTVTAEPVGGEVPGTVSFTVDGKPAGATQLSDILPGAKVTVMAETKEGFVFNKWVFLDENGKAIDIPLTEGALTSPSISFVMPELGVQVQALFKAETVTGETGTYTIEYQGPKGGTLIPDKTTANAGDTITVTVDPDEGYQLVAGSLTYTEAVTGGATNNIDESKLTFTMPANNVTLSCRWEEISGSTTTPPTVENPQITSFVINGVSGAIDQATGIITLTLPSGTNLTSLTPTITTENADSITPASGQAVDFSSAVTYTLTSSNGSSKTYAVTVYTDNSTTTESIAEDLWDKLYPPDSRPPWWRQAEDMQRNGNYKNYW